MILGITPARGGSKGVPRKNIREICGKPLLAWTIETALRSTRLDEYVVSTEDPEIASVATSYGAKVIQRPSELATDEADTLPVLQHVLRELPADIVVVLQATSPVRRPGLIDRCIERFLSEGVDSLGTVHRDHSYEYGQVMPRRQDFRPRMVDNGNVYVISAAVILSGRQIGNRWTMFETSRLEGLEIDDEFDLWLAERVLGEQAHLLKSLSESIEQTPDPSPVEGKRSG